MKWFKHDSDANMDAKLQEVLLDYGLEGYGLYWYCIELIVNKIDTDNLTFELEHDCRIIARNTGSTPQKIQEMMKRFVELGLFESSGGIITCHKLARRLDKSMTTNKQIRGFIEDIKEENEDYSGYVYFVMADNGKEKKIKMARSKNPCARIREMQIRKSSYECNFALLHKIKSDNCISLQKAYQERFPEIDIENKWFAPSEKFMDHISELRHDVVSSSPDYVMLEEKRREEKRREEKRKEDKKEQNADLESAFNIFWSAGLQKLNKKKAFSIFKAKSKGKNSIEFAKFLSNDIKKRLAANQFGFSSLHPTTYLNGERWNDGVAAVTKNKEPTTVKPNYVEIPGGEE